MFFKGTTPSLLIMFFTFIILHYLNQYQKYYRINIFNSCSFRDGRGLAIKFYTDDGNWDLVTLSLPVFPVRDTMRFPSLIHVLKRNPVTHLAVNFSKYIFSIVN